jgi:hypothetical protein
LPLQPHLSIFYEVFHWSCCNSFWHLTLTFLRSILTSSSNLYLGLKNGLFCSELLTAIL